MSRDAVNRRVAWVMASTVLAVILAVVGTADSFAAVYNDGKDKAVDSAYPDLFQPRRRRPGAWLLSSTAGSCRTSRIDFGDLSEELQVRVFDIWGRSVDQVLVAGDTSGYRVYNTFDTGSINNDADIDPNQTATDLMAFDGKNVDESDTIVCMSDHEDSGQNEPYVQDGLPGEVAAKNRPIIQPIVAALGVSAVEGLNTYKVGFGYRSSVGTRRTRSPTARRSRWR